MPSYSLVLPISSLDHVRGLDLAGYRSVLDCQARGSRVEVILAGRMDATEDATAPLPGAARRVPTVTGAEVMALRAGIEAASGDYVVVLDPRRSYPPEAVLDLVHRLEGSDAVLAIAVPRRDPGRSFADSIARRFVGLAGQALMGTSDLFSGLMVVRRSHLLDGLSRERAYGSRLAMDLLSWPCAAHADVPVDTSADDRLSPGRLTLDDVRQAKRVLDQRFGTFSRLVQFCVVGASGMVVDLSLYALLQRIFDGVRPPPGGPSGEAFSWSLATARLLAILVALVWNFTLNRRLTFNDSRGGSIYRQFLTYALGNALGIAVSLTLSLCLPMYVNFFAEHKLAAAVVGIVMATGISFSMSRWVVFIRRPDPAASLAPRAVS